MIEENKLVYKMYQTKMKLLRRKMRNNEVSAHALHNARMLGKACNIIWQRNFEAAANRPNRSQKEINEISDVYCALREQIQDLKFEAIALDKDYKMLQKNIMFDTLEAIRDAKSRR